jgi:hypothetical protein
MDIDQASLDKLIERANQIRKGSDEDPQIAFKIAKRLADAQYLEHARRLADHIQHDKRLQPPKAIEVRQKLALWTSKNPDLPDDSKHDHALEILDSIKHVEGGASLANSTDPETLGIAGGICKRRWLIDGQTQTLERSLKFYERGVAQGIAKDRGYAAINAAFVSDLLQSLDDPALQLPTERAQNCAGTSSTSCCPLKMNRHIREDLPSIGNAGFTKPSQKHTSASENTNTPIDALS